MSVLDRDLVVVSGADAVSFLQGLVSQDLDGMSDGEARPCLLLTPKGKLDVAFRILRRSDEIWLDVDAGFGEALAASLNRFKIRVQVEIEVHSHDWGMVAIRDDGEVASVGTPIPVDGGADVIGARESLDAIATRGVTPECYERLRIEGGVPKMGADLDGSVIPQEASLEHDAVSFTKGCFLGQELVCRIDTRGHVNRFLRRLRPLGPGRPAVGDEIRDGDRVIGAITSVTPDDGGPVAALGFVRRELEPPVEVTAGEGDRALRVAVETIPADR